MIEERYRPPFGRNRIRGVAGWYMGRVYYGGRSGRYGGDYLFYFALSDRGEVYWNGKGVGPRREFAGPTKVEPHDFPIDSEFETLIRRLVTNAGSHAVADAVSVGVLSHPVS